MDHATHLGHLLGGLPPALSDWGPVAGLFVTGLIGAFGHCAGMCAPFVLAQIGSGPMLGRAGGLLPGYHLGRLTTYTTLGAVTGAAGQGLGQWTGLRWLAAAALFLAAVLFTAKALAWPSMGSGRLAARLGEALAGRIGPLLSRPGRLHGYRLGLWLGFLPCGFLYAALAVAAASGSPFAGAAAMAAFALGTMPALMLVGLAGHAAARSWRDAARRLMRPLLLVNGVVLAVLALQLVIGA